MKVLLYNLMFTIGVLGFFSSCISSEEINYLQKIDKQYPYQAMTEYRLMPGDYISCAFFSDNENLSMDFRTIISNTPNGYRSYSIYEDGTVVLPLFGTAKIAGCTVQEAEDILQKMAQESIRSVQVKVYMANNYFYIYANEKRGSYLVYKDNMTIYDALAMSQQTTTSMDLTRVKILRRKDDGTTETKVFDLRSQDVIQSEFYYIKPNDQIYFPTNKNSFFNIDSLGSFTATMMVPLTFLLYSIIYTY